MAKGRVCRTAVADPSPDHACLSSRPASACHCTATSMLTRHVAALPLAAILQGGRGRRARHRPHWHLPWRLRPAAGAH
eukprot:356874-Chlamydomonas_euryale.AAC.3